MTSLGSGFHVAGVGMAVTAGALPGAPRVRMRPLASAEPPTRPALGLRDLRPPPSPRGHFR
eukprot:2085893-Prymnesium_polylepis.1